MVIIQKKLRIKSGLTIMGEAQCPARALWRRLAKKTSAAMRTSEGELRCSRSHRLGDRSSATAGTNSYRDYAIVTLFTDTNTGKIAIVAAGVGRGGTIAAGE